MNSVESSYQQGNLQISNVIAQLQFAPYVVILVFLDRLEKLPSYPLLVSVVVSADKYVKR